MKEATTVLDGPDKWLLITSFADLKPVTFKLGFSEETGKIQGIISQIKQNEVRGNKLGDSFTINLKNDLKKAEVIYCTESRHGYIEIEDV